jgi:hypothetical protein
MSDFHPIFRDRLADGRIGENGDMRFIAARPFSCEDIPANSFLGFGC